MRSGDQAESPLLGFPKIAPPSTLVGESAFRIGRFRPILGTSCRSSRAPLCGFAPPQQLSTPRPCRFVSPCCRSWGSPCFSSSRNEDPHGAVPALRSFPSTGSVRHGAGPCRLPPSFPALRLSLQSGARASLDAPLLAIRSPLPLPSRPFPPSREKLISRFPHRSFPRLSDRAGTSGPCSSDGSVAWRPFPVSKARCSPGLGQPAAPPDRDPWRSPGRSVTNEPA